MSLTIDAVRDLVTSGKVRISEHGYDELSDDDISSRPREVERTFHREATMSARKRTKYVHEGKYVAEVDVDILEDDTGWSPYLTVEDACRMDDVREALRRGDISAASRLARVFRLEPIAAAL